MSNLDKTALRAQIINTRLGKSEFELDEARRLLASHSWAEMIPGLTIACYSSLAPEPDTKELRDLLANLGKKVYLPIIDLNHSLNWGLDQAPYTLNSFGINEPALSDFYLGEADAIILPALAVDVLGNRLGRGAGYFDRALAGVPTFQDDGPLRIALVFDEEIFPEIPVEDHDAGIDLIVSPTRVITAPTR